jgi:predicted DNA-binding transcriptional regulator AlpA
MSIRSYAPDTDTAVDNAALPAALGNKRDVAALAGGFSVRWVDDQMRRGMPHLKLGARRARFDLAEVREWLKERYHVQHTPTRTRSGKVAERNQ